MDRGLDGQIIPDIIYGYVAADSIINITITKPFGFRPIADAKTFLTISEYRQWRENGWSRRTWKAIRKTSTLLEISEAFRHCYYRRDLPTEEYTEYLKRLFDLEEWKLTQMPLYKHVCPKCQHEETDLFRYDDPPPKCPKCDIEMVRILGKTNFKINS